MYSLFALDPEGRLRYVCSSSGAFDNVAFPAEIETRPYGYSELHPGIDLLDKAHGLGEWVPGLPLDGRAALASLQASAGAEGILILWWPEDQDEVELVFKQFQETIQVASPFFRMWQNDRRHQRRYLRLKALEELSLAVASSLNVQEVLLKTWKTIVGPLGFDRAAIYVLSEDHRSLSQALSGADPSPGRTGIQPRVDLVVEQHPAAKVARGELEYYLGPHKDASQTEHLSAIVPLRSGGQVAGIVIVDNARSHKSIREEHLRVLLPFAAHAGVALCNARMHEQLAAHARQLEDVERQRQWFEREVILSVTEGKLHLCEPEQICGMLGDRIAGANLRTATDVAAWRRMACAAAAAEGMVSERRSDFELCLGEAATNCYKHAGGGDAELYRTQSSLQIRVHDTGPGIQPFLLPRATLLKGYSTKTSLGMGFALILALCDRLYLATSPQGTDLLIVLRLQTMSEVARVWEQLGFDVEEAIP